MRKIDCSRAIWFPSKIKLHFLRFSKKFSFSENWIIERTYPLPIEKIPTQFAKYTYSSEEEEQRQRLLSSDVNDLRC